MIATSLRLRLVLAFLAVVALMVVVGVTSYAIHRRIQSDVAVLRPGGGVDLREVDLDEVALEIEGHWDPRGVFVATDVEVLPGPRRPKLRGVVQDVDPARRTVTLYGIPIRVPDGAEFLDSGVDDGEEIGFADLRRGQRIEVTCNVPGGRWSASKIGTRALKQSDKIKGTVTASEVDGSAPETVELHGLRISLAAPTGGAPEGALRRIEMATGMTLALQECRTALDELVGRTRAGEPDRAVRTSPGVHERISKARRDFDHYLRRSRSDEPEGAVSMSSGAGAGWLGRLANQQPLLGEHVETLEALARDDLEDARTYLADVFDPFLAHELLPLLHGFVLHSREELGDQLRSIATRTATTTRVALVTSAVAALVAVVLGVLIWRSIHRPILALHAAAQRLGRGQLDTRVAVHSRDEIGALAEAFNRMASELASTTVSLAEKELLLREVHHRVKNNMQVISSLLAMQSSYTDDPRTIESFELSQNRIRSMSIIHEQLYQSPDLAAIDVPSYFGLLTTHLSQSFDRDGKVEIQVRVEDVSLDVDQALACGLIVNELVANAYKHAFPPDRTGRIRVTLSAGADGDRVLVVADDGRGLVGSAESERSRTLGMSLVETLVQQLGGSMSLDGDAGVTARIVFPRPSKPVVAA